MRLSKSGKRAIRYLLIELAYTFFNIFYFRFVKQTYSVSTAYEAELFSIYLLIAIFLIWFLGPMLNRWFMLLYGEIFNAYLIAQTCYRKAFQSYFRFNTVADLLSEVWGARDSAAEFVSRQDIAVLVIYPAVTILFIVLYFLFERKVFRLRARLLAMAGSCLLFFPAAKHYGAYRGMIEAARAEEDGFQENLTDYYIYNVIPNSNQFVEKFGLIPFAYRDAQTFLNKNVTGKEEKAEIEQFLSQRKEQAADDHTGIFAGKNAFFIQAESFNNAALDEELTPTLWKMYSEGIRIQGFNTPALPGSTSDTEFMANTSLIPSSQGHAVCYTYPTNAYVTTLPGMFTKAGYQAYAYHNNYSTYYNRAVTMLNFGYQEFYDSYRIGVENEASDSEVMNVLKWIYAENEDPWMAYWITYSGHQPYDSETSPGVTAENLARVREKYPDLEDAYAIYLAKNMDLDQCLTDFMQVLSDAGKLDDVVFVLFGDHEAKGLNFYSDGNFYQETGKKYEDSYRYTDLYFYNSAAEPEVYDKVGTVLDLVPTVADLWGFSIDTKTILGNNLFDPDYRGFFFSEWDRWETDDYIWDFMNNTYTFRHPYDEAKAAEEMAYYTKEKQISGEILELDFFADGSYGPSVSNYEDDEEETGQS